MHSRLKWSVCLLGIAALFVAAEPPARAQDQQHVVSLSDLSKDGRVRLRPVKPMKKLYEHCFLPTRAKRR